MNELFSPPVLLALFIWLLGLTSILSVQARQRLASSPILLAFFFGIFGAVLLVADCMADNFHKDMTRAQTRLSACEAKTNLLSLQPRTTYRVTDWFGTDYYVLEDDHARQKLLWRGEVPKKAAQPLLSGDVVIVDSSGHLQVTQEK